MTPRTAQRLQNLLVAAGLILTALVVVALMMIELRGVR